MLNKRMTGELKMNRKEVLEEYQLTEKDVADVEATRDEFIKLWPVDDLEWMKQRKKQWPAIKRKILQIHKGVGRDAVNKKKIPELRNYYLSGAQPFPNQQPYPLAGDYHLIFTFWLCPVHTKETWKTVKILNFVNNRFGREPEITYHVTPKWLRKTAWCYPGTEEDRKGKTQYDLKISPSHGCEAIFEPEVMDILLEVLPLKISKRVPERFFNGTSIKLNTLLDYLGGGNAQFAEFNPNNPLKYWIDEIVALDLMKYFPHIEFVALVWHVCAHQESHHPLQVKLATALKEGIIELKPSFDKDAQASIDKAIALAKEGIPKAFYTHGLWETEVTKFKGTLRMGKKSWKLIQENLDYRIWFW